MIRTSQKPRLMVMGHGGHGKDTVCEILRDDYGFTFTSSSWAALDVAIWPIMQNYYANKDLCFADRHQWRTLWFELIYRYNHESPARLAEYIFCQSDIYCGIRSIVEFEAAEKARLFDYSVWVDAGERLPSEDQSSIQVGPSMADLMIANNGTLDQLRDEVGAVAEGWLV